MAHDVARFFWEHAERFIDRQQAVREAIEHGIPLSEIEEYLDWLELVKPLQEDRPES